MRALQLDVLLKRSIAQFQWPVRTPSVSLSYTLTLDLRLALILSALILKTLRRSVWDLHSAWQEAMRFFPRLFPWPTYFTRPSFDFIAT